MKRILRHLGPFAVLAIFALAAYLLYHELRAYHIHSIRDSLRAIPAFRMGLAVLLTAANYAILIGYDVTAVRALGLGLPRGRVALASFTGFVTSYNFGALLGGTSVRYRLYSAWGVSPVDVVRIVALVGLTFWVGALVLGGAALLTATFPHPASLPLPIWALRPLGALLLLLGVLYLLLNALRARPFRIGPATFELPGLRIALLQLLVASADLTVAALALWVLLPADLGLSFLPFLGIYLLAVLAVVFTNVPGGVGVFELVVLKLAAVNAGEGLLASLLIFRVVYYLLPLLCAAVLLIGNEILLRREATRRVLAEAGRVLGALTPPFLSLATFLGGAILLLSGALPAIQGRIGLLQDFVPLPLVEASHFFGSLVGATLLVLSRGLTRRLDSAFWLTAGLLGGGIAFSLLKGLDYEEALVLGAILLLLVFSRRRFYRQGSLLHGRFSFSWTAGVLVVITCAFSLGMFAYKHVEYSSDLWWHFAFLGDAPRFLRATVGSVAVVLLFGLWHLVRPARPAPSRPGPVELEAVSGIVRASPRTADNLALLGDKSFLFSPDQKAFVMYAVQGRSFVAMGEPVGDPEAAAELVWSFRELADRAGCSPVFYQVEQEHLPLFLDQGLSLLKLGEEGRVPLADFSLEGSARKALRQHHRRLEREGAGFEIVPAEAVPGLTPALAAISDDWLTAKGAREKGFSLGFFDPAYLARFPCALARHNGQLSGFANVWEGAGVELSVDLMRTAAAAPSGLMEYLFIELMLWGRSHGYEWFNLGMAPLSGMSDRPLAPLWDRAAGLVWRHGDNFYNFQGLRRFKEKFDPVWRPKYLASPGGLALPRILADVAALIWRRSGGDPGKDLTATGEPSPPP